MKMPGAAAATDSVCGGVGTPSIRTVMLVDALPAILYGATTLTCPGEAKSTGPAVPSNITLASALNPDPKMVRISPGAMAPGAKLPALTTALTAGATAERTAAESGCTMSDDSSTASKSDPCSFVIWCRASL